MSKEDLDLILSLEIEERDKEIERLKEDNEYLNKVNIELSTEKNRLNNIINKAVEYIEYMQNISKNKNIYVSVYDLVKLLKGEDKN